MTNQIEILDSEVVIHEMTIKNMDLVEYLQEFENPKEAIESLIQIALDVRTKFITDSETQTIRDAVDAAIVSIDESYERMIKDLKAETERLVDPENGPVIKALNTATGDNLKKLLNPESIPGEVNHSPIARLRVLINEEIGKLSTDIGEIKSKLGLTGSTRKTTFDGVDFEEEVDREIQKLAKIFGDTAESTGATPEIGRAKKGDTKVTLNVDDTSGHTANVIWEAKTSSKFKSDAKENPKVKDDLIRKALNETMELRNASVGVFVIDSAGLDLDSQPIWREYEGNKLLLVLDSLNPDPEIIRVGYLWARWKAKAALGKIEFTVDSEGIENVIKQLVLKLSDLRKIKIHHGDALKALNGASGLVKNFHNETKQLMNELAQMISVKMDEVPDFEEN
jgi:hypothetical protein